MNKRFGSIAAIGALVALSGCASDPTTCPLNNTDGYCASVEQVDAAARSHAGSKENVFGNEAYKQYKGQGDNEVTAGGHVDHGVVDPGPGVGLSGPIYTPAQPRRLWVAPWTDANGVVHSGEYLYFLRPGHWRYGPLEAPGSAAGVMGPVAPEDLGFDPEKLRRERRKHASEDSGNIERPATTFTPPTPSNQRASQ